MNEKICSIERAISAAQRCDGMMRVHGTQRHDSPRAVLQELPRARFPSFVLQFGSHACGDFSIVPFGACDVTAA